MTTIIIEAPRRVNEVARRSQPADGRKRHPAHLWGVRRTRPTIRRFAIPSLSPSTTPVRLWATPNQPRVSIPEVTTSTRSGTGNNSSGFLYSSGVMTNLNNLISHNTGWTIVDGVSINNLGQILAIGYNSSLVPIDGSGQGYLLRICYAIPTCAGFAQSDEDAARWV